MRRRPAPWRSGQGVAGSQAAAGVTAGPTSANGAAATNATIAQIGPVAQTLDPIIQESNIFSHQTAPQFNNVQSILPVLVTNTHNYTFNYQEGFLVGGNVTVSYHESYLNENAPTDVLNPSSAPSLTITFQQNLLRGFGIAGEFPHHPRKPIECKGFRPEFQDSGEQCRQSGPELLLRVVRRVRGRKSESECGGGGTTILRKQ